MDPFEIDLVAKTTDKGGIEASFAEQLAQFGEPQSVELLETEGPYRVDTSNGKFYFEVRRRYNITL